MSLGQTVRLDLEDGRAIETTYDGRDIRAWELEHDKSALVHSMSLSMLTWLGHHAAVRRGELNGDLSTFPAFDQVCVSVEGVKPGPTRPPPKGGKRSPRNRGAASSAPSPSAPESPSPS